MASFSAATDTTDMNEHKSYSTSETKCGTINLYSFRINEEELKSLVFLRKFLIYCVRDMTDSRTRKLKGRQTAGVYQFTI